MIGAGDKVMLGNVPYVVGAVNREGWVILKPERKETAVEMMARLGQHAQAKKDAVTIAAEVIKKK